MRKVKLVNLTIAISLIVSFSSSQSVTLSGYVVDVNSKPVPFASVSLINAKLGTTTNESGYFSFENASPVASTFITEKNSLRAPVLENGKVRVVVAHSNTPVMIETFSISGQLISRSKKMCAVGDFWFPIINKSNKSQMYCVRVSIGKDLYVFTTLFNNGSIKKNISQSPSSSSLQKRTAVEIDTLSVQNFGYLSTKVPVTSYSSSLGNIQMQFAYHQPGDPDGMMQIPKGNFMMGSSKEINSDAYPEHKVIVSAFYMDSTEVTQKQFRDLLSLSPWENTDSTSKLGVGPNLPAHSVNWYDAALYCNARNKKRGFDTIYSYDSCTYTTSKNAKLYNVKFHYERKGYRLPSEAEWEYACRAKTATSYYWGEDTSLAVQYAWYRKNSDGVVHSVANKLPNTFRLYDMSGNVVEWTTDNAYLYDTNPKFDPFELPMYSDLKQLRSGSIRSIVRLVKATQRYEEFPSTVNTTIDVIGFRTVLPVRK